MKRAYLFIIFIFVIYFCFGQNKKQNRIPSKCETDKQLDSIISTNVNVLRSVNDTVKVRNQKWEQINKSIKKK